MAVSLPKARLSKIGDMTEEDAYNHSDNARQHAYCCKGQEMEPAVGRLWCFCQSWRCCCTLFLSCGMGTDMRRQLSVIRKLVDERLYRWFAEKLCLAGIITIGRGSRGLFHFVSHLEA